MLSECFHSEYKNISGCFELIIILNVALLGIRMELTFWENTKTENPNRGGYHLVMNLKGSRQCLQSIKEKDQNRSQNEKMDYWSKLPNH